jgi:hypothetical protein
MKLYFNFNITKKIQSKNNFENDFFKIRNNITYIKIMENIYKKYNMELINNKKIFRMVVNNK